jgi:hypothetical protein
VVKQSKQFNEKCKEVAETSILTNGMTTKQNTAQISRYFNYKIIS